MIRTVSEQRESNTSHLIAVKGKRVLVANVHEDVEVLQRVVALSHNVLELLDGASVALGALDGVGLLESHDFHQ